MCKSVILTQTIKFAVICGTIALVAPLSLFAQTPSSTSTPKGTLTPVKTAIKTSTPIPQKTPTVKTTPTVARTSTPLRTPTKVPIKTATPGRTPNPTPTQECCQPYGDEWQMGPAPAGAQIIDCDGTKHCGTSCPEFNEYSLSAGGLGGTQIAPTPNTTATPQVVPKGF